MTAQFQDITPPKRSIRDIPLKNSPPPAPTQPIYSAPPPPPTPPPPPPLISSRPRRRRSYWKIILGLIIILALVFLGLSFAESSVTLEITPVSKAENIDQTSSSVPYTSITLEQDGSATAPATGSSSVSTKASGEIIIYNNYSSATQSLVATTRFQTPEGLVYRIDKNITVPGKVGNTPGSVGATVYADQPGNKYNVGLKDFTIPGFNGTPKSTTFYARSKTPLDGGFIGVKPQVSDADAAKAHSEIEANLNSQLLSQARGQTPDNFVLLNGALLTQFTNVSNASVASSGMAMIEERATATGFIFNRADLTAYLIQQIDPGNTGSSTIVGLDNLKLSILNKTDLLSSSSTKLSFRLTGQVQLVSTFDGGKLRNDLAGKSRGDVNSVLRTYPAIQSTKVVFRPIWQWKLPKDPARIVIDLTIK